jgi:N6-L-threonylcarbamoyladenine synthase
VSFSGLKTALLRYVQQHPELKGAAEDRRDFGGYEVTPAVARTVASYQEAIVQAIADRTRTALRRRRYRSFILGGGVSLNSRLREVLGKVCASAGIPLLMAKPKYTGDNGAMIAALAYYRRNLTGEEAMRLDVAPSLPVG